MSSTIIYLIGFSGVGKLTIAKELSRLINARIVDNHLINNPIFQLIPLDGRTPIPRIVWGKIAQIREIVFNAIEEISPSDFNFIFTNELFEADIKVYHRVAAIAQKRKSVFIPIRLICDLEELCRRVSSEERTAQFKMTSIEATKAKFEKENLLLPKEAQTIDVTHLSPKEVAEKIAALLKKN